MSETTKNTKPAKPAVESEEPLQTDNAVLRDLDGDGVNEATTNPEITEAPVVIKEDGTTEEGTVPAQESVEPAETDNHLDGDGVTPEPAVAGDPANVAPFRTIATGAKWRGFTAQRRAARKGITL